MIIIQMEGGLGNQLFRYSLSRSIQLKNNIESKLDIFTCDWKYPGNYYMLDSYNTMVKKATSDEILKYNNKKKCIWDKKYVEDVFNIKDMYLMGNFESDKYFKNYSNIIRNDITLKNIKRKDFYDILNDIENTESIGLTFRVWHLYSEFEYIKRGELSKEYYFNAINKIVSVCGKNVKLFIFSDFIEWVNDNIKFNFNHRNVSNKYLHFKDNTGCNRCLNEYAPEDLILLSKCKHHIICNSTFSWWGAWLSNNNGMIISPKSYDIEMPSSWIKI